jgi:6-phosphofructokinase
MGDFKLKRNRIGVLTSGSDCAGLNAAIRAITYRAIQEYGLTVIGQHRRTAGTAGTLSRPDDGHGRQRISAQGRHGAGDRQ